MTRLTLLNFSHAAPLLHVVVAETLQQRLESIKGRYWSSTKLTSSDLPFRQH